MRNVYFVLVEKTKDAARRRNQVRNHRPKHSGKNLTKPEKDIGGNSLRFASLETRDRAVTS